MTSPQSQRGRGSRPWVGLHLSCLEQSTLGWNMSDDQLGTLLQIITSFIITINPLRRDIGSRMLYRDAHMTGWAYKIIQESDLKFPMVYGEGKRSRLLATIGVTRGFGDHDLRAQAQTGTVLIKPFLSPQPEVCSSFFLEIPLYLIVLGAGLGCRNRDCDHRRCSCSWHRWTVGCGKLDSLSLNELKTPKSWSNNCDDAGE